MHVLVLISCCNGISPARIRHSSMQPLLDIGKEEIYGCCQNCAMRSSYTMSLAGSRPHVLLTEVATCQDKWLQFGSIWNLHLRYGGNKRIARMKTPNREYTLATPRIPQGCRDFEKVQIGSVFLIVQRVLLEITQYSHCSGQGGTGSHHRGLPQWSMTPGADHAYLRIEVKLGRVFQNGPWHQVNVALSQNNPFKGCSYIPCFRVCDLHLLAITSPV